LSGRSLVKVLFDQRQQWPSFDTQITTTCSQLT
jgi:hypothetical protein